MPSSVYNLPPGVAFADALAAGLLARWPDPLALTQAIIFLPNRRSMRAVREAFLRAGNGRPLLLPRLLPLGDMDADELALLAGHDISPSLPNERRQVLLTRLIHSHQPALGLPQAVALAEALARLMDEAAEEKVDLDKLDGLAPAELALHWQTTLNFLKPVLHGWPKVLDAQGAMDASLRRRLLIEAQARHWRDYPPTTPVIIAGSTSVLPGIVALMETVLTLPQGEIILPGLPDFAEVAGYWQHLEVSHPFAEIKELLDKLKVPPETVRRWPSVETEHARQVWQAAFLPAEATPQWLNRDHDMLKESARNLSLAVCAGPEEEAGVIALRLRAVLEEPGKTAMLVTPDRGIARRVVEIMRRWDVQLADSAGQNLSLTVPAVYFRLVARAALSERPVDLLLLLKHPLAAGGLPPAQCRDHARAFELLVIRQSEPHPDWPDHPARTWLDGVREKMRALVYVLQRPRFALIDALNAHIEVAEALASTDAVSGAQRLWQGESGEALAEWLSRLMETADLLPPVTPGEYEETLVALMSCGTVRPRRGSHPRLSVLGTLEAELIAADVVILAGLNEGSWPALPRPDPWLSRPMRAEIGLQAPERDIGREAHDFLQLAAHHEVLLTRSIRVEGAPTVPSRWWQRLEAVLDTGDALARGLRWRQRYEALDKPEVWQPIRQPRFAPPLEARPRRLSVTRIEVWRRDPYALYAERILRLKKLEPLEPVADVAQKGNFLHEVLERFLKESPRGGVPAFLRIAEEIFESSGWSPVEHTLWWPRLTRLAEWFTATQAERSARPLAFEARGEKTFTLDNGLSFTLDARTDRLDRLPDGAMVVLDYKSGALPDARDQRLGYSPQLPLTALLVESGGFGPSLQAKVATMEFWKLATAEGGEIHPFKVPVEEAVADAYDGLLRLIAVYDNPSQPYIARPLASHALRYNDYAHLERIKEWSTSNAEEEG